MEEVNNMTLKDFCFRVAHYKLTSPDKKLNDLLLLMLMIIKKNGGLKIRGSTNESF